MPDREEIINFFVKNFIRKDKRERCLLQLTDARKRQKFTDALNHNWETIFDMRFLSELEKNDGYSQVRQYLNLKDEELCYLISDHKEYDDKFLPFKEAFKQLEAECFASVLINVAGNKLFYKSESMKGGTPMFIGKK
jgi:hypothetical protein